MLPSLWGLVRARNGAIPGTYQATANRQIGYLLPTTQEGQRTCALVRVRLQNQIVRPHCPESTRIGVELNDVVLPNPTTWEGSGVQVLLETSYVVIHFDQNPYVLAIGGSSEDLTDLLDLAALDHARDFSVVARC
jgi:hypothetical protein